MGPGPVRSVTIYSSPGCGYCVQAKEYLNSRGYAVIEKDFDENKAEAQARAAKFGLVANAVPVLDFGSSVQIGFNKAAVDAALTVGSSGTDVTGSCLPSSYFHADDIDSDTAQDKRWADGSMPQVGGADESALESSIIPFVIGGVVLAGMGWLVLKSAPTKRRK